MQANDMMAHGKRSQTIRGRQFHQDAKIAQSNLGDKAPLKKGSSGKMRNIKGHNRNLDFLSLVTHVNNACRHFLNKNISLLAKYKELMKGQIRRMSNEGQLHQLPFIVVQKAAGPQVGEVATHIKQEAKGWLFVPLPPIRLYLSVSPSRDHKSNYENFLNLRKGSQSMSATCSKLLKQLSNTLHKSLRSNPKW